MGAQILLTYDDMRNPERRRNLENTLKKLLEWSVVPLLNENDAVATDEIKFGDNDSLSAKVAAVIGADRLVICTDVEGLFDKNPAEFPKAKLIHQVAKVTDEMLDKVGRSAGSAVGTGGMYSKLSAAREATQAGIETWLVKGDIPDVLLAVARDAKVGTRVVARPVSKR
jgi:glutamate 5-kinase